MTDYALSFSKFRKKPVVIEAIKYDGTEKMAGDIACIEDFGGMLDYTTGKFEGLYIDTLEGRMKVSEGDYIIRGIAGEYYPCKPDIFKKTYTVVK